jgi:hypothetical protein
LAIHIDTEVLLARLPLVVGLTSRAGYAEVTWRARGRMPR